MQKKLKSMFRRSMGKGAGPSKHAYESNGHTKSNLQRAEDQTISEQRDHPTPVVINDGSQPPDRVRPISSAYGSPATQLPATDDVSDTTLSNRDYNAPISMPSRRKEVPGGQNATVNSENGVNHDEVVNGNHVHSRVPVRGSAKGSLIPEQTRTHRFAAEPATANHTSSEKASRGQNTDDESFASAMSSVSSSDYSETHAINGDPKRSGHATEAILNKHVSNTIPIKSTPSSHHKSGFPLGEHGMEGGPVQFQSVTKGGQQNTGESELFKQLRLDGVVDLTDTVDTDGDIKWAPAVTHEIIKPHQHEIVQQKVFREIHNYEYFHRIQPVMMTEVLPPRHWIPNPSGDGLIEISADELPARTGENRWWSVIQHESPYSAQKTQTKWRTEPEIIERGMTVTEEGFERRETIIIHPPTLASLEGYSGPVQPVHFDHKTGKRWMGEMSTMEELQDLQKLLDSAPEAHAFQLNELNESLPKASSNVVPKRKSVPGETRV